MCAMLRYSTADKLPELARVVELLYMTELVNHYVVGELRPEQHQAVVEVQVTFLRAAAPARALIADSHPADR